MGNANDLGIHHTHEVNPIRSNIHYIGFVVSDLLDVKVDIVRLVVDEGLFIKKRDFFLLVTVEDNAVVLHLLRVLFTGRI